MSETKREIVKVIVDVKVSRDGVLLAQTSDDLTRAETLGQMTERLTREAVAVAKATLKEQTGHGG